MVTVLRKEDVGTHGDVTTGFSYSVVFSCLSAYLQSPAKSLVSVASDVEHLSGENCGIYKWFTCVCLVGLTSIVCMAICIPACKNIAWGD